MEKIKASVECDDGAYFIWIRDDDALPDVSVRYFLRSPDEAWDLIRGLLGYLEEYYYERGSDEGLDAVRRVQRAIEGGSE